MNTLLIDDDPNKSRQIRSFLAERFPSWHVVERKSFQSGLKEAILNPYDLILLDMTMPTYDVKGKESGGDMHRYAGTEVIRRLHRRQIPVQVIVVTQFESFGEGDEMMTLDELRRDLQSQYSPTYTGAVFYEAANTGWQDEIVRLIPGECLGKKGEE